MKRFPTFVKIFVRYWRNFLPEYLDLFYAGNKTYKFHKLPLQIPAVIRGNQIVICPINYPSYQTQFLEKLKQNYEDYFANCDYEDEKFNEDYMIAIFELENRLEVLESKLGQL